MKRWTHSSWMKPVAAGLAWVFTMTQALPVAYAGNYLRQPATSAAVPGIAASWLGDASLGGNLAGFLGAPNVRGIGARLVEPARAERRLFYVSGPRMAAHPFQQQVDAYAAAFERDYGIPYGAKDELRRRLQDLSGAFGLGTADTWVILDEVETPALARAGGIGSVLQRSLVEHGLNDGQIYLSSLALLEALRRQGPDGEDALQQLVAQARLSRLKQAYVELDPEAVEAVNRQIAAAGQSIEEDWDEASVRDLIARRQAVARRAAEAPVELSLGPIAAETVEQAKAALAQLTNEGAILSGAVEPQANGSIVRISYRGSNVAGADRARRRIDQIAASAPARAPAAAATLSKEQARAIQAEMFILGDGTAVGPALGALAAVGALDAFSRNRRSVTAGHLREHLIGKGLPSVNDYFHSPMRALEAAGLITRRGSSTDADNMLFTVTDAGLVALQHAPSFAELFEFLPAAAWLDAYFLSQPRDPPAEQVLPQYRRLVAAVLAGFPEDASSEARRLEEHFLGELLVPTLVALKNIPLDYPDPKHPGEPMNLLDHMALQGTVDLSRIGAEVDRPLNAVFLEEAFRLLTHPRLGWVTMTMDPTGHMRAQWTPAGVEAVRLAWTPGVFFSYYPTRAGFRQLLTTVGTPEHPLFDTVFPRNAQGRETHIRRPLNSKSTYANHGRYYADILKRTTPKFNGDLDAQPRFHTDIGTSNGLLVLEQFRHMMEETDRGRLLKSDPYNPRNQILLVLVDLNAEALDKAEQTLLAGGVGRHQYVRFAGDISKPKEIDAKLREAVAEHTQRYPEYFGPPGAKYFEGGTKGWADLGLNDGLVTYTFLMHNRSWAPVKTRAAIESWRPITGRIDHEVFLDPVTGRLISVLEHDQQLFEFLEAYKAYGKHGIVTVELSSVDPKVLAANQGRMNGAGNDAPHSESNQFTRDIRAVELVAERAGYEVEIIASYPKTPEPNITVMEFKAKPQPAAASESAGRQGRRSVLSDELEPPEVRLDRFRSGGTGPVARVSPDAGGPYGARDAFDADRDLPPGLAQRRLERDLRHPALGNSGPVSFIADEAMSASDVRPLPAHFKLAIMVGQGGEDSVSLYDLLHSEEYRGEQPKLIEWLSSALFGPAAYQLSHERNGETLPIRLGSEILPVVTGADVARAGQDALAGVKFREGDLLALTRVDEQGAERPEDSPPSWTARMLGAYFPERKIPTGFASDVKALLAAAAGVTSSIVSERADRGALDVQVIASSPESAERAEQSVWDLAADQGWKPIMLQDLRALANQLQARRSEQVPLHFLIEDPVRVDAAETPVTVTIRPQTDFRSTAGDERAYLPNGMDQYVVVTVAAAPAATETQIAEAIVRTLLADAKVPADVREGVAAFAQARAPHLWAGGADDAGGRAGGSSDRDEPLGLQIRPDDGREQGGTAEGPSAPRGAGAVAKVPAEHPASPLVRIVTDRKLTPTMLRHIIEREVLPGGAIAVSPEAAKALPAGELNRVVDAAGLEPWEEFKEQPDYLAFLRPASPGPARPRVSDQQEPPAPVRRMGEQQQATGPADELSGPPAASPGRPALDRLPAGERERIQSIVGSARAEYLEVLAQVALGEIRERDATNAINERVRNYSLVEQWVTGVAYLAGGNRDWTRRIVIAEDATLGQVLDRLTAVEPALTQPKNGRIVPRTEVVRLKSGAGAEVPVWNWRDDHFAAYWRGALDHQLRQGDVLLFEPEVIAGGSHGDEARPADGRARFMSDLIFELRQREPGEERETPRIWTTIPVEELARRHGVDPEAAAGFLLGLGAGVFVAEAPERGQIRGLTDEELRTPPGYLLFNASGDAEAFDARLEAVEAAGRAWVAERASGDYARLSRAQSSAVDQAARLANETFRGSVQRILTEELLQEQTRAETRRQLTVTVGPELAGDILRELDAGQAGSGRGRADSDDIDTSGASGVEGANDPLARRQERAADAANGPPADQQAIDRFNEMQAAARLAAPPPLVAGSQELISSLAGAGVSLWIASGMSRGILVSELSSNGLQEFFADRVFPAPAPKSSTIRMAGESLSRGGRVVMVGDAAKDMEEAGRVPGTVRIGRVRTGSPLDADYYLRDFTQVGWVPERRALTFVDARTGRATEIEDVGAVVFDFDGTLVESHGVSLDSWGRFAADQAGLAPGQPGYQSVYDLGVNTSKEHDGHPVNEIVGILLERLSNVPPENLPSGWTQGKRFQHEAPLRVAIQPPSPALVRLTLAEGERIVRHLLRRGERGQLEILGRAGTAEPYLADIEHRNDGQIAELNPWGSTELSYIPGPTLSRPAEPPFFIVEPNTRFILVRVNDVQAGAGADVEAFKNAPPVTADELFQVIREAGPFDADSIVISEDDGRGPAIGRAPFMSDLIFELRQREPDEERETPRIWTTIPVTELARRHELDPEAATRFLLGLGTGVFVAEAPERRQIQGLTDEELRTPPGYLLFNASGDAEAFDARLKAVEAAGRMWVAMDHAAQLVDETFRGSVQRILTEELLQKQTRAETRRQLTAVVGPELAGDILRELDAGQASAGRDRAGERGAISREMFLKGMIATFGSLGIGGVWQAYRDLGSEEIERLDKRVSPPKALHRALKHAIHPLTASNTFTLDGPVDYRELARRVEEATVLARQLPQRPEPLSAQAFAQLSRLLQEQASLDHAPDLAARRASPLALHLTSMVDASAALVEAAGGARFETLRYRGGVSILGAVISFAIAAVYDEIRRDESIYGRAGKQGAASVRTVLATAAAALGLVVVARLALANQPLSSVLGAAVMLGGGILLAWQMGKTFLEWRRERAPVLALRVPFLAAASRMSIPDAERWLATRLEDGRPFRLRVIEDEEDLSTPRYVVIERRRGVVALPVAETVRNRVHLYLSPEGETALVIAPETEPFAAYRPARAVAADDLIHDGGEEPLGLQFRPDDRRRGGEVLRPGEPFATLGREAELADFAAAAGAISDVIHHVTRIIAVPGPLTLGQAVYGEDMRDPELQGVQAAVREALQVRDGRLRLVQDGGQPHLGSDDAVGMDDFLRDDGDDLRLQLLRSGDLLLLGPVSFGPSAPARPTVPGLVIEPTLLISDPAMSPQMADELMRSLGHRQVVAFAREVAAGKERFLRDLARRNSLLELTAEAAGRLGAAMAFVFREGPGATEAHPEGVPLTQLKPGAVEILAQWTTPVAGARTGQTQIDEALKAGAQGILAGHSETRPGSPTPISDTDQDINAQIRAAIERGAHRVILAVGETEEAVDVTAAGHRNDALREQIVTALQGLRPAQLAGRLVVAYEPRWAIAGSGSGKAATPEYAQAAHYAIRQTLSALYGDEFARNIQIIYGGSANASNAAGYLSQSDVDGLLVGGASKSTAELVPILQVAQGLAPQKQAASGRGLFVGGNQKTYKVDESPADFLSAIAALDPDPRLLQVAIAPTAMAVPGWSRVFRPSASAAELSPAAAERAALQQRAAAIKVRWDDQRGRGRTITRLHTPEQVAALQIEPATEYRVQNGVAWKLYDAMRRHQADRTAINSMGPFDEMSIEAMARAGIEGVYIGGWAESLRAGTSDQARYTYTYLNETVSRYSRLLQQHARHQAERRSRMTEEQLAKELPVDFLLPLFVDIDTGHLAPKELVESMMTHGTDAPLIGAVHIEDQSHGCKKCGHMAGKVLVSTQEHINRLNEVRLQLDVMGLDTLIVARTDAEAAEFITSVLDSRDHPFILGATAPMRPYHEVIQEARASGRTEAEVEQIHRRWKESAGLVTLGDAVANAIQAAQGRGEAPGITVDEWRAFAKTASRDVAVAKAREHGINVYTAAEWRLLQSVKPETLEQGISLLWDWDLPRTEELSFTLWMIESGTDMAIARSSAFLPYADVQWMEQHQPDVEQTTVWASALQDRSTALGVQPPLLANNTSASFYWRTKRKGEHGEERPPLTDGQLRTFLDDQAKAGVQFHFGTYFGAEIDHVGMERFLREFKQVGMLAWANFQDEALRSGNAFLKGSQKFAGVEWNSARDAAGRGASVVAPTGERDTGRQFSQGPASAHITNDPAGPYAGLPLEEGPTPQIARLRNEAALQRATAQGQVVADLAGASGAAGSVAFATGANDAGAESPGGALTMFVIRMRARAVQATSDMAVAHRDLGRMTKIWLEDPDAAMRSEAHAAIQMIAERADYEPVRLAARTSERVGKFALAQQRFFGAGSVRLLLDAQDVAAVQNSVTRPQQDVTADIERRMAGGMTEERAVQAVITPGMLIRRGDSTFASFSREDDVARVVARTFNTSGRADDRGYYNHWMPGEGVISLTGAGIPELEQEIQRIRRGTEQKTLSVPEQADAVRQLAGTIRASLRSDLPAADRGIYAHMLLTLEGRVSGEAFQRASAARQQQLVNEALGDLHVMIEGLTPLVRQLMTDSYRGKPLYVVPLIMGPADSAVTEPVLMATDSPYVVANQSLMATVGEAAIIQAEIKVARLQRTVVQDFTAALAAQGLTLSDLQLTDRRLREIVLETLQDVNADFIEGLHSMGESLNLPMSMRFFTADLTSRVILSIGSGYGGNALLGKKFLSLRIAGYAAAHPERFAQQVAERLREKLGRPAGTAEAPALARAADQLVASLTARLPLRLAEHMAMLEIVDKQTGQRVRIGTKRPSASGKSNKAGQVIPRPWQSRFETRYVSDDIIWAYVDAQGQLRGLNAEAGIFPVVPGTDANTSPILVDAFFKPGTIFTNEAYNWRTGEIWWAGKTKDLPQGPGWISWNRKVISADTQPDANKWSHPNGRATLANTSISNLSPDWNNPEGIPLDVIEVGGRMTEGFPLVYEPAITGVDRAVAGIVDSFMLGRERTAAEADGAIGTVETDFDAMGPFAASTEANYLEQQKRVADATGTQYPRRIHVNPFRKGPDGKFLYPGFEWNFVTDRWIMARMQGDPVKGAALRTPIGDVATPEALSAIIDEITGDASLTEAEQAMIADIKAKLPEIQRYDHEFHRRDFNERWLPHLAALEQAQNLNGAPQKLQQLPAWFHEAIRRRAEDIARWDNGQPAVAVSAHPDDGPVDLFGLLGEPAAPAVAPAAPVTPPVANSGDLWQALIDSFPGGALLVGNKMQAWSLRNEVHQRLLSPEDAAAQLKNLHAGAAQVDAWAAAVEREQTEEDRRLAERLQREQGGAAPGPNVLRGTDAVSAATGLLNGPPAPGALRPAPFAEQAGRLGVSSSDPGALATLTRAGLYGAESALDAQERDALRNRSLEAAPLWFVVQSQVVLNPQSMKALLEYFEPSRQGRNAFRLALIMDKTQSADAAEAAIQKILAALPEASAGTLTLKREDILVVPGGLEGQEIKTLLTAIEPGSEVHSAVVDGVVADSLRGAGITVYPFTVGSGMDAALVAAAAVTGAGRPLSPALARRLQEIQALLPEKRVEEEVAGPVRRYREVMGSVYAAAIKE